MLAATLEALVWFLAFLAPGYGLVCWLHRADRFSLGLRWTLAFSWSIALFGLVAGPFLWCGGSTSALLRCLAVTWSAYGIVGALAYLRARRLAYDVASDPTPPTSVHEDQNRTPAPAGVYALLAAGAGLAAVFACLWARPGTASPILVLWTCPVVLAAGFFLGRRVLQAGGPWLRWTSGDYQPPPRLWTGVAGALILFQAVSAACYDRPNRDDCFYAAAMMDYQHAAALNNQEPTHREGFPIPAVERLLCWELWGAVLCQLTGLHPLILFHTLLPGILVLFAYAAYAALLRQFLPIRWVPLALLGLSAYHIWGISGHATTANHFLGRVWQGKAMLLHIAIPLLVVMLTRYAAAPGWRRWLSLLGVVVFGLAVSMSAIFLEAVLVVLLLPALWLESRGRRLRILGGSLAALVPLVLCGLLLQAATQADPILHHRPPDRAFWTQILLGYAPVGSAEMLWLLSLPLAAVLLPDGRARGYLITFPVLLAITFVNPALYDFVAAHLTSYYGYYRLLWLFPVGPGLGVLVALGARCLYRCGAIAGQRQAVTVPLGLAAILVVGFVALPDGYIWGRSSSFIGPLGTPHLAQNPEKLPADLVPLAQRMLHDPDISHVRLLCDEPVASFLAGYAPVFRFVQTRAMYTAFYLKVAGRSSEGWERCLLAELLDGGRGSAEPGKLVLRNLESMYGPDGAAALCGGTGAANVMPNVGALLHRYRVKYILTAPGDASPEDWQKQGYHRVDAGGGFTLWQAP